MSLPKKLQPKKLPQRKKMTDAVKKARSLVRINALKGKTEGLFAGTSGNLSIFIHEEGLMVITPTSIPYDRLTDEDVSVTDLDGRCISGREPSSEWRMHAEIYRYMPEVSAVVHTHSPYATAFAACRKNIPYFLIEMLPFLGGSVPVSDFAPPGSTELGKNAVSSMKDRNACLLASHGVVAVGKDIEQAYIRAEYVEDAAKIYQLAKVLGEPTIL